MINRIRTLVSSAGKKALIMKVNELTERLNQVSNIRLAGKGRVNKTPFGTTLHVKGGGKAVPQLYAKVVRHPSYPDPTANPITDAYAGRTSYSLRLIGEEHNLYDKNIDYSLGDSVVWPDLDSALYTVTTETPGPNHTPNDTRYWSESDEIVVEHALGHEQTSLEVKSLRDCVPWFEEKEIVPIVTREVDGETRYYINLCIFWTGAEGNSSLRYNETEERTMAVFT